MIDEGIVGVGIVAAIELDEVWRDIVVVHERSEVFLVEAADDAEGEPVVHAEDAVYCVFRGNVPHAVVLDSIAHVCKQALLNLVLLLLHHRLKHVVARDIVRIFLSPEQNILALSLFVQLLPRCLEGILKSIEHISEELGFGLGDERPNLNSREKVHFLFKSIIVDSRSVSTHHST